MAALRGTMKIIIKRTLIFSCIHFTVLITCLITSFSLGMSRFDTGDGNETIIETVTGTITNILIVPANYLWTPWASKNLSNIVEWILFLSNSLLWGYVAAFMYSKFKKPHNQSLQSDAAKPRR